MEGFFQKVWLFILLYGGWEAYQVYVFHEEKLETIEGAKPRIQTQIRKANKERKQIRTYLRDIEEAKKNIELVAQEVERLQKKLPETIQDAENLSIIKKIATDLNIKKIFLSPETEENKGFYFIKRYAFSGEGTYLQFLVFFEKIAQSERLLNISEVELVRSDEPRRGRFQLINAKVIVESYRYNPDHKEDRGIQNIEKNFAGNAKKPAKKKNNKKKGKKNK